jgi:hypothetical protein
MSIESLLTRELDIRFIDARFIVTEAKLNLGMQGYTHPGQRQDLHREALRIFEEERPSRVWSSLWRMNQTLEHAKSSNCTRRSSLGASYSSSSGGYDVDSSSKKSGHYYESSSARSLNVMDTPDTAVPSPSRKKVTFRWGASLLFG